MSAPPRVLDRLRTQPDGPLRVLHRGPNALYLDLGGWCLGVVDQTAARLPNALVTTLGHLGAVAAGSASCEGGTIRLGSTPLVVGRLRDVRVPRVPTSARWGGPVVPTLHAEDVADLLGRGEGLTPSGDDLLCGWIAVHRALGVATDEVDRTVRELARRRTTLLSATLLDCALHGEVLPEFGAWLAALGTDAERPRARALASIGHSSGRALLEGGRRALATLAQEAA